MSAINHEVIKTLKSDAILVEIKKIESAEIDEMWGFVQSKKEQRWLWHAIDHHTGTVLAYVFGKRSDEVFLKLKGLLSVFKITRFYTDNANTYHRHISQNQHTVGKLFTQKIERKHLTLRTRIKRLARKTICFSKLSASRFEMATAGMDGYFGS